MNRVASYLLLLCLSVSFASAQDGATAKEQQLFGLLTQERLSRGLPALHWDGHLAQAARAHSQLLAKNRKLSHQFPGEPELQTRVAKTGLRFDAVGENVSYAPTVDAVHQGFMHSPPHRANILSREFNAVGITIIEKGGQLYVTEDFAHRAPVYSERQFQDDVVEAFNAKRRQAHITPIGVESNGHLHHLACRSRVDPDSVIQKLPGVSDLVVFTSSNPEQLPAHMQALARDRTLHRMSIGVCFMPGAQRGFASFQVVAAFYPVK